jgi:23S rRNA (uracil1939-C5)-methyltransferase
MAIGDIVTVTVEKTALGGDGLVRSGGKRIFIPLAAPGDRAAARITEDHPAWARAEMVEILEPSPGRTTPRCPRYGICGGCNFQHLSYDAQLRAKKEILLDALCHSASFAGGAGFAGGGGFAGGPDDAGDLPDCTVVPSEPWEYRNRVSLHAIRANRGPRCGFRAAKSSEVIPLEDCPAADPLLRKALPVLLPPPGKDRFTVYGRGETLLAEEGTRLGGGAPPFRKSAGIGETLPSRGTITLLDKKIQLDAGAFFQSNAAALENLIRRLRIAAEEAARKAEGKTQNGGGGTPGPRMADLYAGAGTFSLFLSDLFPGGVDLLEAHPPALGLARINLGGQTETGRFRFFLQKDEPWVTKHGLGPYDFVVADPPRQGLSPSLARALCRSGPPALAYVSCEAASFARDYRILAEGYRLESLELFDFYPQTAHIECMGIFIRK